MEKQKSKIFIFERTHFALVIKNQNNCASSARHKTRSQNSFTKPVHAITSQICNLYHPRSHIAISTPKEQPKPIRPNLSRRTQKNDVAPLTLVLAGARVRSVAVVAQRFVRVGWHHELAGAALENFRRFVFVQDDVTGGVVAVLHPPRGGLSTGQTDFRQ